MFIAVRFNELWAIWMIVPVVSSQDVTQRPGHVSSPLRSTEAILSRRRAEQLGAQPPAEPVGCSAGFDGASLTR